MSFFKVSLFFCCTELESVAKNILRKDYRSHSIRYALVKRSAHSVVHPVPSEKDKSQQAQLTWTFIARP